MSRKFSLFSIALFFSLVTFSQAKKEFEYLQKVYTLVVDTPANGKTLFQVCNAEDACQKSPPLIWPFDTEIFSSQFLLLLKQFDSTDSDSATAAQKKVLETLKAWTSKQFNPAATTALDNLRTGLRVTAQKESDLTPIGEIILKTGTVQIGKTSTFVEEVRFTIENGVIARKSLYVIMGNGDVFFNRHAPINFPNFNSRRKDILNNWLGDDTSTITLDQVLQYIPLRKLYYPEDREFRLRFDGRTRDTMVVSSSLNNMLEVNVYTDLLGILGDKPNGLIQTEVAGHFVSNTRNLSNVDITFHNFMRPFFRLSRFDSKYRSLDSTNVRKGPAGDTLDRTYMTQISYLQAGLKINVLRFGVGINQVFYLNVGGDVNLVNADSIYKKDLTYFNYFGEINYTITRLKNFGMDATLKWSRQHLSRANSDVVNIINRGGTTFFSPMFNLYYFPLSDAASRIYFRFAYIANREQSRSNYTQFQVGYKTNLNF